MNNIKIGMVLITLGLLLGALFFFLISQLNEKRVESECIAVKDRCSRIESSLSLTHAAIGVIAAVFTLGLYLIFFSGGEEAILRRLEEEKNRKIEEERFSILLRAFDENEGKVLKVIKEQPGIEQNTLRLKTGLSKAKISQVVREMEEKKIIIRKVKNKTFSIWLSDEF